jgi:hypothetical protein
MFSWKEYRMATDIFRFSNEDKAAAFEIGVQFTALPVSTGRNGTTLTVTDPFGDETRDTTYEWIPLDRLTDDLGDFPLISTVLCPSSEQARAFASGFHWYAGAFADAWVDGKAVWIREKRQEGDPNNLCYALTELPELIANYYRSQQTSVPA